MTLVEFVPPVKHPLWKLCLQMGITDVVVKVRGSPIPGGTKRSRRSWADLRQKG